MPRICVLGPVEIRGDGDERILPGRRMQRVLLAAFALRSNTTLSTETLVDLLWGATPPASARANLKTHIAALRRLLPATGRVRIDTDTAGYRLVADPSDVDCVQFVRLAREGHHTLADAPAAALPLLRRANHLWSGAALEGLAVPAGLRPDVSYLDNLRLDSLADEMTAGLQTGLDQELLPDLRRLTAQHPLHEPFHANLMLALHRSGRTAEALVAYQRLREELAGALGVEPDRAVQTLHERILADDAALRPPRSAPAVVPRQLPPDVAGFTGRTRLLDQLTAVGSAPAAGVAVVSGPPGVGKTALAVHWSHAADGFPDGQLYLDLRGYSAGSPVQPADAIGRMLRALGAAPGEVPVDLDEAVALYRSMLADRSVLVVLDNAGTADQVRPLLPGAPSCATVVTSRNSLAGLVATDGAVPIDVGVLTQEEAMTLVGTVITPGRLSDEPVPAAELARLCDHLPLALRIAAAHLADLPDRPISDYVAELAAGDRVGALAVTGDEHASVAATFDLSYQRLAPEARHLFRALGASPLLDVTPEVAAVLAGGDLDRGRLLLRALRDARLVEESSSGRYAQHDLIAAYACQRASTLDTESLVPVYEWYLSRVDQAARIAYPHTLRTPVPADAAGPASFDDYAGAVHWLDSERANLVALTTHAAQHGPHRFAWLLAESLDSYFWLVRLSAPWLAVARAGVAAATAHGDAAARAAAEWSLAHVTYHLGRHDEALALYESALDHTGRSPDRRREAVLRQAVGIVHWEVGRLDTAVARAREAVAISRTLPGAQNVLGANLFALGAVLIESGPLDEAIDCLEEARLLQERIGSAYAATGALFAVGHAQHLHGQLASAQERLDLALDRSREIQSVPAMVFTRAYRAELLRDLGRPDDAFGDLRLALDACETAQGCDSETAYVLAVIGSVHEATGDRPGAEEAYRRGLQLAGSAGASFAQLLARLGLAACDLDRGDLDGATDRITALLDTARTSGTGTLLARGLVVAARAALARSEPERARRTAAEAVAASRKVRTPLEEIRALQVAAAAGDPRAGGEAQTIADRIRWSVPAPQAYSFTYG